MDRRYVAGFLFLVAGAAGAWSYYSPLSGPVAAIFLPLVLLAPGYAIALASLESPPDLISWAGLAQYVATSVAVDVAAGLVLNLLPVGLTNRSWAGTFVVLTACCFAVTLVRRPFAQEEPLLVPKTPTPIDRRVRWGQLAVIAMLICIIAGAIAAASVISLRSSAHHLPEPPASIST